MTSITEQMASALRYIVAGEALTEGCKRRAREALDRFDAEASTTANVSLDPAETATVLAALRTYQQAGYGDPAARPDDIHDIATNGDELMSSLDDAAIDDLCERINCGG